MPKRRILITGATSGIGLETARGLASQGHQIIMACRNLEKAARVKAEFVNQTKNEDIELIKVDLSSLASITSFAAAFQQRFNSLDVLINNAGVFCDSARKTIEGYEMTMGVNYLGTYYLTELLLPILMEGTAPRILMVASKAGLFGKLNFREAFFARHSHGFKAYSASKLAQIIYTIDLNERLANTDCTVFAIHPGSVATGIWQGDSLLMRLMGSINKTLYDPPAQGAETSIYLASSPHITGLSGHLIEKKNQIIPYNQKCLNERLRRNLIQLTDQTLNSAGWVLEKWFNDQIMTHKEDHKE